MKPCILYLEQFEPSSQSIEIVTLGNYSDLMTFVPELAVQFASLEAKRCVDDYSPRPEHTTRALLSDWVVSLILLVDVPCIDASMPEIFLS